MQGWASSVRRCGDADAKRFVGIDVAKAQLDVAIGPNGESFSVANDETGIGELPSNTRVGSIWSKPPKHERTRWRSPYRNLYATHAASPNESTRQLQFPFDANGIVLQGVQPSARTLVG